MPYRYFFTCLLCIVAAVPAAAQVSRGSKLEILRTVIAEQGAARIALPFGADGVEVSEAGEINKEKLEKELKKNGQSIEVGKVVTVTEIAFSDNKVEVELDGGGKNKKGIFERIQVGIGSGNSTATPAGRGDQAKKAKGSKIVVRFAGKAPPDLTPERLKTLLDPILDFNKRTFMKTGLESLPPEFQEAVKAKQARIGMDRNTVIMAMGRPDTKSREKIDGIPTEDWIYYGRGYKAKFVRFQDNVVVQIKEY